MWKFSPVVHEEIMLIANSLCREEYWNALLSLGLYLKYSSQNWLFIASSRKNRRQSQAATILELPVWRNLNPWVPDITEFHYRIKSCISDTVVKDCHLLHDAVRMVVRFSLLQLCRDPRSFYYTNSYNTCVATICIFRNPHSWIHDIIVVYDTHRL